MKQHLLESAEAIYHHPGEGHDRTFLDDTNRVYADLDGSGGAALSGSIHAFLPRMIVDYSPLRADMPSDFMVELLHEADSLPGSDWYASAAFLFCLDLIKKDVLLTYVPASDGFFYAYHEDEDELQLLGHTQTRQIRGPHGPYTDTADFLGMGRSRAEAQQIVRQIILPGSKNWLLLAMSDGARDGNGHGISERKLKKLARATPVAELPHAILDRVRKSTDASVVAVRHTVKVQLPTQAPAPENLVLATQHTVPAELVRAQQ